MIDEPQVSMMKLLRPFADFEATFAGQPQVSQVAFFEEDQPPVDPRSQVSGAYSTSLISGVAVPPGARLTLAFPVLVSAPTEVPPTVQTYNYTLIWRQRPQDERVIAKLGSYANEVPQHIRNYTSRNGNVVLPAGQHTTVSIEGTANEVTELLSRTRISVGPEALPDAQTLVPGGGSALIQQGIYPGFYEPPTYCFYSTVALGDELIILAQRAGLIDPTTEVWNFQNEDAPFSRFYGFGAVPGRFEAGQGIYLWTGRQGPDTTYRFTGIS
jgi:hypothetical protein